VVGFPRRRWRRGSQAERDRRSSPRRAAALVSIGSALALSCTQGSSANPGAAGSATPAATSVIPTAAPSARAAESNPSGSNPAAAEGEELEYDPLEGKFTLADATAGLAGSGKLFADIETSAGTITCELLDDKAPVTVANFVGLARGVRPWRHSLTKRWLKKPAYDGGTFHRVIKGFMIQGGDPLGNGVGEPGYVFKDEIWKGSTHDRAGLLCMANRGRDTNGAQFFITDAACKHLDKAGHTIFGRCGPESVIHKIASTPADARNKPLEPQTIKTVVIRRARNK
jgi:peptidyl-prolyl cis-trans isomerase A (cyclophilin A)